MAVDYRPIDAGTVKNTWPIPNFDAILQDVGGAEAFATINFTYEYWQLQMNPESQNKHAFMTTDGVMQLERMAQTGCNRAANFQLCVETCHSEIGETLLTRLNDFALFDKIENELLLVLQRFFSSLLKTTFYILAQANIFC